MPSAHGYGPHCWRLVRPETPPQPAPAPEPAPRPRKPRQARTQVPGQTEINLNDRTDTMPQTAAARVAEFLPELIDIPDESAQARHGALLFAADVEQVLDERDTAIEHLRRLADHQDDDCQFDHHGRCQIHSADGSESGKCGVAEARAFLAEVPVEEDLP